MMSPDPPLFTASVSKHFFSLLLLLLIGYSCTFQDACYNKQLCVVRAVNSK